MSTAKRMHVGSSHKLALLGVGLVAGLAGVATTGVSANADTVHTVQANENLSTLAGQANTTVSALASANGISNEDLIYVGQQIKMGGTTSATVNSNTNATTYVTKAGDTLWSIANRFGTTVENLKVANGLTSNLIYVNQTLKLKTVSNTDSVATSTASSSNRSSDASTVTPSSDNTAIATSSTVPSSSVAQSAVASSVPTPSVESNSNSVSTATPSTVPSSSVAQSTVTSSAPTPSVESSSNTNSNSVSSAPTPSVESSSNSASSAPTPSVESNSNSVASASNTSASKEWIAQRESGGSYTAQNGRYYGRYQLDKSYLNGDYSASNQERVAAQYMQNRYGSWDAAKAAWQSQGWW